MFYSDFLQNPLQNWGVELFFDQFCEIQAYPNLEGIPKNQKTNKPKKQKNNKPNKTKTKQKKKCLTQNAANIQKPIVTPFCLKHCFFVFFVFFSFLVFWYSL